MSPRRIAARRRRFRVTAKATIAALAAAAALTGGLAVQMASGHDPALGKGKGTAATKKTVTKTTQSPAPAPAPVVTSSS